jgi:hypothetical protein
MGKEQDYRLTAAEMVDRAHKATTAIDKRRLLGLAEKWLPRTHGRNLVECGVDRAGISPSAASARPRSRSGRSAIIRWSERRSEAARPRRSRLGGMAEPALRRASGRLI